MAFFEVIWNDDLWRKIKKWYGPYILVVHGSEVVVENKFIGGKIVTFVYLPTKKNDWRALLLRYKMCNQIIWFDENASFNIEDVCCKKPYNHRGEFDAGQSNFLQDFGMSLPSTKELFSFTDVENMLTVGAKIKLRSASGKYIGCVGRKLGLADQGCIFEVKSNDNDFVIRSQSPISLWYGDFGVTLCKDNCILSKCPSQMFLKRMGTGGSQTGGVIRSKNTIICVSFKKILGINDNELMVKSGGYIADLSNYEFVLEIVS